MRGVYKIVINWFYEELPPVMKQEETAQQDDDVKSLAYHIDGSENIWKNEFRLLNEQIKEENEISCMLLIKLLIYFYNIFIAQAAVMKITNLPLKDHSRSPKYNYQSIYNDGDFENKHKIKRHYSVPVEPVCKEEIKPQIPRGECDPLPVEQKIYRATRLNGDAFIERKSEKEKILQHPGPHVLKLPGKREAFSNLTAVVNASDDSSTNNYKFNDSYNKVLELLHPDLDNFYDSELIRKLSDSNGKLPTSLKVVIPPDKEPIVVYNESEDDSFNSRKFIKREAITRKSNVDYDYNYYDEQQSDNSQLNSDPFNARIKYFNEKQFNAINEQARSPNSSVDDTIKEINKPIALYNSTALKASTPAPEIYLSFEPITSRQEIKEQSPKNRSKILQMRDNFGNDINIGLQRKGTCPPPEIPGKQGCHPGSGVPKNPMMPPLTRNDNVNGNGKDLEYEKLMKGETSERVLKTIVDKIHKNPSMAVELGICDFDLAEMRTMFRKLRNRDKKDCCSRLSGELKCFLNWVLTLEPSRKKRAEREQEETSKRFSTCNQFPKFDLMASECYKQPSPQYEKLVQRVEEYRDENNVK